MGVRACKVSDVILRPEEGVDPLHLARGFAGVTLQEIIVVLREDERGARRVRHQKVRLVEARPDNPRWVLLGIAGHLAFEVRQERADVAARRGHRQSRVKCGQVA